MEGNGELSHAFLTPKHGFVSLTAKAQDLAGLFNTIDCF